MAVKKFLLVLLFVCSALSHSFSYAAPADDLSNLLNAVQTMRANFTQVVYDGKNKVMLKSYGRMSMQRPGKFRWEVTKPIPQTIIANASRLWIYDPDLEQVTIRSLKKAAGETPALLLSHVDSVLNQSYRVEELPSKKEGLQSFSLLPKSADSMFASIQMDFVNKQIQAMRLRDHLGHTTAVTFQKTEFNINLPASLFVFKPPARVDVIDETK
jgi:outer membrane lipoprotein carrier protein